MQGPKYRHSCQALTPRFPFAARPRPSRATSNSIAQAHSLNTVTVRVWCCAELKMREVGRRGTPFEEVAAKLAAIWRLMGAVPWCLLTLVLYGVLRRDGYQASCSRDLRCVQYRICYAYTHTYTHTQHTHTHTHTYTHIHDGPCRQSKV